ncbi:hypothetical protein TcasGA2_TC032735 [Tribolium castaneum]|uniref:Uncharacterized protein n=1 Tax=Tribolium castaneum TaxID=7070 RepID=A0A139WIV9_TRICA|nr:hypothetical protein TcasGA2_TC032735 [Tribolium castaneum]
MTTKVVDMEALQKLFQFQFLLKHKMVDFVNFKMGGCIHDFFCFSVYH